MEASGNDSALLSSLLQSTQYRASEALNLVASLQLAGGSGEGLSAEQQVVRANMRDRMADMGDMTVFGGMKALAPGMHERTLQRRVAGQMRELFDALDRLEQQGAGMSEQQFRREAADVRDVLDRARAAVALLNTDGMSVEDRSLHAGLNDLLDRCAVRLGNLSGCSLHGEVVKAVDELMPVIDPDMCRALASKTGLTRLRNALMDVAGGLARYNADLRALKGDVQAGASSPDRVRSGLMQAWRRLRSGSTDKNSTLLYALYLAGSGGLSNSVALPQLSRKVRRFHFGPGGGQSVCRSPQQRLLRGRGRGVSGKICRHALDPSAHCRGAGGGNCRHVCGHGSRSRRAARRIHCRGLRAQRGYFHAS